jgi:hypothetical protein
MATPTGPERRFLAAGARRATAWRTALALGATYGLNCKSISGFNPQRDTLVAAEIDNPLPFSGALDVYKPPDIGITTDFLYAPGMLGMLIAQLFGTAGAPTGPADTSAYTHTFQWADSNWNQFATLAVEMPGIIFECPSAKATEWTLKSSEGGFVQSELKLRGNKVIDNSAVNTLTQMDAITYDDRGSMGRVMFGQQAVYMNGQAVATDVLSTTALECSGVEAAFKRTGHDGVVAAGYSDIQEPAEGGYPDIRVKLKFAHMDAVNKLFLATAIAETTQKMAIRFTGTVLAGAATVYHALTLYFPRMRMLCPEASFEEIVSLGVELIAEEASAAPTGMSYVRPYMTLVNKRSTNYLA